MKRILVLACLFAAPALAQKKFDFDLQKVIPPAPTAAALGQYGNTPVGLYTGTANVSIPIYTIQLNDISLPISLNYSTGGVKLSEYAPWTGLGWNLSAGGVITRSSFGRPDEWGYLAETIPVPANPTMEQKEDADDGLQDYQPDFFTFNFAGYSGRFFISKSNKVTVVPHQNIKVEPLLTEDITIAPPFMDIVPQYTQWRITTEDGTIYEFKDMEKTTRHSYDPDDAANADMPVPGQSMGSVSSWFLTKIKSAGGSEINFVYTDYSLKYDMPGSQQYYDLLNPGEGWNTLVQPRRNTKNNARYNTRNKRLSKITFRNGEVEFLALTDRCDLVGDKMLTTIQVKDKTGTILRKFNLDYIYMTGGGFSQPASVTCTNTSNLLTNVPVTANRSYRLMLNKVTETDGTGTITGKKHQLEYYNTAGGMPERQTRRTDHWGYYNGVIPENNEYPWLYMGINRYLESNYYIFGREPSLSHTQQGVLQRISYPTGGTTTFEYELNDAYVGYGTLPPITTSQNYSMSINYDMYSSLGYSYYLNQDENKIYYRDFTINGEGMTIKIDVKGFAHQPISPIGMRFDIVDLSTNTRIVTMNEIDMSGQKTINTALATVDYYYEKFLPRGNYRITFQPDEYFIDNTNYANTYQQVPYFALRGWTVLSESGQVGHITRNIGGLRLKKMTDLDSTASKTVIRSYTYKDSTAKSSGSILNAPRYNYVYVELRQENIAASGQPPTYVTVKHDYMLISSEPNFPLYSTQGSSVGYSAVQVTELDNVGAAKGKSEYLYFAPKDFPDVFGSVATSVMYMPYPPADNRDWQRGQLISQTDFRNDAGTFVPVRKITNQYAPRVLLDSINGLAVLAVERRFIDGTMNGRAFVHAGYSFTTGYRLLTSTTETLYSTAGNHQTLKNFEYTSAPRHLYPTAIKIKDSEGNWQVSEMKYPQDYLSLTATDNLTKGIKNLQTLFVLAPPVEQTSYVTDAAGGNKKMTASQFTSYHPTLPFPSEIAAMEVAVPMSGFTPSAVTAGAVVRNASYKPRVLFSSYGPYGTLREQQKVNDVTETFVWGYDDTYPVAKVDGSNYATVIALVTASVLQAPTTESALITELNKIHNGFASGIQQVNTFTWKPLVGMLSQQSPTRQTTRYEYDALGRLKLIRDNSNRIVKQFDYQFQSIVP